MHIFRYLLLLIFTTITFCSLEHSRKNIKAYNPTQDFLDNIYELDGKLITTDPDRGYTVNIGIDGNINCQTKDINAPLTFVKAVSPTFAIYHTKKGDIVGLAIMNKQLWKTSLNSEYMDQLIHSVKNNFQISWDQSLMQKYMKNYLSSEPNNRFAYPPIYNSISNKSQSNIDKFMKDHTDGFNTISLYIDQKNDKLEKKLTPVFFDINENTIQFKNFYYHKNKICRKIYKTSIIGIINKNEIVVSEKISNVTYYYILGFYNKTIYRSKVMLTKEPRGSDFQKLSQLELIICHSICRKN